MTRRNFLIKVAQAVIVAAVAPLAVRVTAKPNPPFMPIYEPVYAGNNQYHIYRLGGAWDNDGNGTYIGTHDPGDGPLIPEFFWRRNVLSRAEIEAKYGKPR